MPFRRGPMHPAAPPDGDAAPGQKTRILQQVDAKLEQFKEQIVDGVTSTLLDRVDRLVDSKLEDRGKDLGGGPLNTEKLKEAMTAVVTSALFDGGILEKLVERVVGKKLPASRDSTQGGAVEASVASLLQEKSGELLLGNKSPLRQELHNLVQKEVAAALSSEDMKILIDDKFRAISIYLKTDVIPKTVTQILRNARRPGGPT